MSNKDREEYEFRLEQSKALVGKIETSYFTQQDTEII